MKAEWERGAPGRGRELWESGQLRFRELPWARVGTSALRWSGSQASHTKALLKSFASR